MNNINNYINDLKKEYFDFDTNNKDYNNQIYKWL